MSDTEFDMGIKGDVTTTEGNANFSVTNDIGFFFRLAFRGPYGEDEVYEGPKLTESAGYIPANIQIRQMIAAGERLGEMRKELYDFPDGKVDEDFIDPTRGPNFDFADADALKREAVGNLKAQMELVKEANITTSENVDAVIDKPEKESTKVDDSKKE
jgi:hypothetical protein